MPAPVRVPQEALDREFDLVHRVRFCFRAVEHPALQHARVGMRLTATATMHLRPSGLKLHQAQLQR